MGNAFAYIALFTFLPVGVALFTVLRPARAALVVFLTSFMFLPELVELDLPLVPGIGKQEVASIACALGVALRARSAVVRARPFRGPDLLVVLLFVGDLGTAMTNRDPVIWGTRVLPGLSLHEGMSLIVFDFLRYGLPFFLGRALFTDARGLRDCLSGLALAGVVYTPLLFVELMMSPQLHQWVYGFHQHDFIQTIRGGGYRPMVFMAHGLAVALFMTWASMSALALARAKKATLGVPAAFVAANDFTWLLACKSLGAAIYGVIAAPVIWVFRVPAQMRVATLLALGVLAYPGLRAAGAFPEREIVQAAHVVSERASQSIDFRFTMESLLAERAAKRPVFGWGRFGRSMIFDEVTERPASVSDGHWIVVYGISGVWGFVCVFGLMTIPIFSVQKKMRRVAARDTRILLAGLTCIVAVAAVDLIPNGLQNSITIFLAGVLCGTGHGLAASPTRTARTPTNAREE